MNVLIVNCYSPRNRGDGLILDAMIRLFRDRGCDVRLIVDDPREPSGFPAPTSAPLVPVWPGVRPARPELMRRMAWTFARPPVEDTRFRWADVCVSAGGGYLYDDGSRASRLNVLLRLLPLRTARAAGVPVVLFSQSIGPFRSRLWARLAAHELRRASLVIAREEISLELCRRLGVAHAVVCDDPAFAFSPPDGAEDGRVENARARIGVTVLNELPAARSAAHRRYLRALSAGVASAARARDAEVLVLSQVDAHERDSDLAVGEALASRLSEAGLDARFLDLSGWTEEEVSACYRGLDLVVASRLHSAILALREATPAVALSYMPKVDGVFDRLGMRELVLPAHDLDADALADALVGALDARPALNARLRRQLPAVRASAARAADLTLAAARGEARD